MSADRDGRRWERGWHEHERAQLLRLSSLTLPEKIQWLEDAHAVVQSLERSRAAWHSAAAAATDRGGDFIPAKERVPG